MSRVFVILSVLLIGVFVASASDQPAQPTPMVRTVSPSDIRAGAAIVASGQNLGKAFVNSVFLTKGEETVALEVLKQADDAIHLKVPVSLKPGRYGVMVLTK